VRKKTFGEVYGPITEQGFCGIITNGKLKELHKKLDLVLDIESRRSELLGRVVRMDQTRVAKIVFERKPKNYKNGKAQNQIFFKM
jgi:hypothetical protein